MPCRFFSVLCAMLLLAAIVVPASSQGVNNKIRDQLDEIATSIKKGKNDTAAKQASKFAKIVELEDVMHLFKPRKKGGLGIGLAAKPVDPDGIERAVISVSQGRTRPAAVFANATAFMEMAWRLAAIAETTKAKAPEKNRGNKLIADWHRFSGRFTPSRDRF